MPDSKDHDAEVRYVCVCVCVRSSLTINYCLFNSDFSQANFLICVQYLKVQILWSDVWKGLSL